MKAIIEFNLPEEAADHKQCAHVGEFVNTLIEIDQWDRTALKHGHSFKTPEEVF